MVPRRPAVAILAGVVSGAAVGAAPIVVTATAGAVAMVLLGVLSTEEAYRAIAWKVISLLAGVLSLGLALERTRGAALLSRGLIAGVGGLGPVALVAAVYLLTTVLTELMSNNAAAVLLAPVVSPPPRRRAWTPVPSHPPLLVPLRPVGTPSGRSAEPGLPVLRHTGPNPSGGLPGGATPQLSIKARSLRLEFGGHETYIWLPPASRRGSDGEMQRRTPPPDQEPYGKR